MSPDGGVNVQVTPINDPSINFTVKELLAKQDGKLDAILLSLVTKVDRTEFEQLRNEVVNLKADADAEAGAKKYRQWLLPSLSGFVALAVSVAEFFLLTHH